METSNKVKHTNRLNEINSTINSSKTKEPTIPLAATLSSSQGKNALLYQKNTFTISFLIFTDFAKLKTTPSNLAVKDVIGNVIKNGISVHSAGTPMFPSSHGKSIRTSRISYE